MSVPLIAFCGRINAGKTFAARWFVEQYGHHHISFADPMKEAVSVIFGMDIRMLAGRDPQARAARDVPDEFWSTAFGREMTPRRILQEFGTEGVRAWQKNVWVKATERRILESHAVGQAVVIDDCRFDNEAAMVRDLGGVVCRICREGGDMAVPLHTSENGVSAELIDVDILNTGNTSYEMLLRDMVADLY